MSSDNVHEAQFELLFAQYEPELRRFLQRYLPDKTDIDDCAQETFLHVWRQESRGALRENPKNYLLTVARNVVRDLWRRNRVRQRQHHVELTVNVDAVRNIQNEKSLAEREAVRLIETHLKYLKEPTKAVFLLFHVEQMTCEAIATRLKMPKRTVEREMARALDFYRSKLGHLMRDFLE
ncbi:MAG: RNA polymerase sigma factor [Rhodospirillaceae bacterium]